MNSPRLQRGRALLIVLFLVFLIAIFVVCGLVVGHANFGREMWLFYTACVFVAWLLAVDVRQRIARAPREEDDDDREAQRGPDRRRYATSDVASGAGERSRQDG
jgi:membrane protein implicated in regulation of membrane protease activity